MKKLFTLFLSLACVCVHAKVDMGSVVYDIRDYGAVNDTTQLSTKAVQRAIDECSLNGGGKVLVASGGYKIGSIVLRSGVDLHIENGATLYGSTDIADYQPQKTDYVSLRTQTTTIQLIYADQASNISITGNGTIDGRGVGFKKLSWNDEGITRPHLLRLVRCSDVSVSDVTLRNSGCWMQHYLACDRVKINNITVFNRNNFNNDALDLDGCHDVVVSGMIADSDDDAITLKSTSPRLCENIVITGCVVSSHCNGIKLGTETNGGFRNINITGCIVKPSSDQTTQFFGHESKRGTSAISLEIVDGGVLENVNVSNIVVEGTESPIFVRLGNRARSYSSDVEINKVGRIHNVHLSNITINDAGPSGSSITGIPGYPVEDIYLSDITIYHAGGQGKVAIPADEMEKEYPEATMWGVLPAQGFFIRHAKNVQIRNLEIKAKKADSRDIIVREDVK